MIAFTEIESKYCCVEHGACRNIIKSVYKRSKICTNITQAKIKWAKLLFVSAWIQVPKNDWIIAIQASGPFTLHLRFTMTFFCGWDDNTLYGPKVMQHSLDGKMLFLPVTAAVRLQFSLVYCVYVAKQRIVSECAVFVGIWDILAFKILYRKFKTD